VLSELIEYAYKTVYI